MKILLHTCLGLMLIYCSNFANAQSLRSFVGMPMIELSGYSTKEIDPFFVRTQQGNLGFLKSSMIGVYGERRFMLQENSLYNASFATATKFGGFGISLDYAGFKDFNEHQIGIAYGRKLSEIVGVGIKFNYYGYQIPTYSKASSIGFEGGFIFHLTQKLNAGIHVANPISGKLKNTDGEKLSSIYKFGLGYDISDQIFIATEILKEENKSVNVQTGINYQFAKKFFAKTGFRSDNNTFYASAGVGFNEMKIDIGTSYHQELGFSPALTFIARLKKLSNE